MYIQHKLEATAVLSSAARSPMQRMRSVVMQRFLFLWVHLVPSGHAETVLHALCVLCTHLMHVFSALPALLPLFFNSCDNGTHTLNAQAPSKTGHVW